MLCRQTLMHCDCSTSSTEKVGWEKDFIYKFVAAPGSQKYGYLSPEIRHERVLEFIRQEIQTAFETGRKEGSKYVGEARRKSYMGGYEDGRTAGIDQTLDGLTKEHEIPEGIEIARGEKIKKAFGGCTSCYGKGYSTVSAQAEGHGDDVSGDAHVYYELPKYAFCNKCDRGKQIKGLISYSRRVGIEEALKAIGRITREAVVGEGEQKERFLGKDDVCDAISTLLK